MDLKIVWSLRAAAHLEDICSYISKDSITYASVFAGKVLTIVEGLSRYPQSGRVVPEYDIKNLRERVYNNYRIVYRVKPDMLEIVAICHGARLLKNTGF